MSLRIRILCKDHPDAVVEPASHQLHWMSDGNTPGVHELDTADLWCPGEPHEGQEWPYHHFVPMIDSLLLSSGAFLQIVDNDTEVVTKWDGLSVVGILEMSSIPSGRGGDDLPSHVEHTLMLAGFDED